MPAHRQCYENISAEVGQSHINDYSGFRCTHSFPVVVLKDYDDSSRQTLQGSLSTASRGGGPERDWPMPEMNVSSCQTGRAYANIPRGYCSCFAVLGQMGQRIKLRSAYDVSDVRQQSIEDTALFGRQS